jgi:hypothetical protein
MSAQHRHSSNPSATHTVRPFTALMLHWLVAGLVILMLLPMPHWYEPHLGWLPFWLVLMPALLLLEDHLVQRFRTTDKPRRAAPQAVPLHGPCTLRAKPLTALRPCVRSPRLRVLSSASLRSWPASRPTVQAKAS